jgi:hypothetical protein
MTATVVLRHKDSNYTLVQLVADVSIFNELPIFDVFGLSTAREFSVGQKLASCRLLPAWQLRHNRYARQPRMDAIALSKERTGKGITWLSKMLLMKVVPLWSKRSMNTGKRFILPG